WAAVYERLKKHDEAMITGHSGDIDSLLILAGLFSAVLTSFLVQVYTQLQPANTPMSTAIALDLSRSIVERLSLPSTSEIFAATSIPAVSPSMVAINALWFMSLVLSLGSALLGISAKQWLRQY
ncbi:hypothetical protein PUNSTDRAFT_20898, partial [Punctularia strigosozonata HHB-11173 SS5]|uniref:uncharacterized protein n=1 Tax=Punctularia strigosozonata (strain HHB-11173) TaxID=741275 RepID=UPI0004416374